MACSKVGIVIVNWNGKDDVFRCLASVISSNYINFDILVVDNGSVDGSVEAICDRYPSIQVIKLDKNLGYTGGNNLGIRWALNSGADWVLLLNNDTVMDPDTLDCLLEAADQDPKAGILGPTVYYMDMPDVIQSAGEFYDHHLNPISNENRLTRMTHIVNPSPVGWVSGCALFARAQMIKKIGELDDRFFAYEEELDWCIRATNAGWRILHVSTARVWHAGVTKDYHPKPYVTYYMTRNHLLLLSKHHAGLMTKTIFLVRCFRTLVSWTIRPRWKSLKHHRNALWKGVVDFWFRNWGPMTQ
jgi:hypothetical protein